MTQVNVRKYAEMLRQVLATDIRLDRSLSDSLQDRYKESLSAVESLLGEISKTLPEKKTYFEFQTLSMEGAQRFRQMCGETISTTDLRDILGSGNVTETIARNLLHHSDSLAAVKARTAGNRTQIFISKESALRLRDSMKEYPGGIMSFLYPYRVASGKDDRNVLKVACTDRDIDLKLRPYILES